VFGARSDLFWQDQVRSGCRTTHRREPPEVGWAPGGLAGVADSVPEHAGLAATRGCLVIAQGICTGAGEVAHGCSVARGDIHEGALPRAGQPSQVHGVSAIRFDPLTGLVGQEGRRHAPAGVACVLERPIEPVPTGPGRRDTDEVLGCRWHCTNALIAVTLTSPTGTQGGHRSAMVLGDIRHGKRRFVDIHADAECARLRHG